jgi:hypothetical protein
MPPGVPIAASADAARIHADRTGGLTRADRNEQAVHRRGDARCVRDVPANSRRHHGGDGNTTVL